MLISMIRKIIQVRFHSLPPFLHQVWATTIEESGGILHRTRDREPQDIHNQEDDFKN